jgi:hypothetical protein
MPIVVCPHCGAQLQAPPELVGKQVTCSWCRQVVVAQVPIAFPTDAAPPIGQSAARRWVAGAISTASVLFCVGWCISVVWWSRLCCYGGGYYELEIFVVGGMALLAAALVGMLLSYSLFRHTRSRGWRRMAIVEMSVYVLVPLIWYFWCLSRR